MIFPIFSFSFIPPPPLYFLFYTSIFIFQFYSARLPPSSRDTPRLTKLSTPDLSLYAGILLDRNGERSGFGLLFKKTVIQFTPPSPLVIFIETSFLLMGCSAAEGTDLGFVLLFSTLVCCQPAFLFHKFPKFIPPSTPNTRLPRSRWPASPAWSASTSRAGTGGCYTLYTVILIYIHSKSVQTFPGHCICNIVGMEGDDTYWIVGMAVCVIWHKLCYLKFLIRFVISTFTPIVIEISFVSSANRDDWGFFVFSNLPPLPQYQRVSPFPRDPPCLPACWVPWCRWVSCWASVWGGGVAVLIKL